MPLEENFGLNYSLKSPKITLGENRHPLPIVTLHDSDLERVHYSQCGVSLFTLHWITYATALFCRESFVKEYTA